MEDRVTKEPTGSSSAATLLLMFGWVFTTMLLWWFALYQAPDTTPEWLLRAQAACFGSTENGLPDSYGWAVLILAPGSFFLALVVAMGAELRAAFAHISSGLVGKLFLIAVTLLATGEVVWAAQRIQQGLDISNTSFESTELDALPENYPMGNQLAPELGLVDQNGNTISLQSLKGESVILSFAFAHCKTICPAIVSSTRAALNGMTQEKVRLLIVTLDPWRDTPSSLPSLAKKWEFDERASVLSGEVEAVNSVLKAYSVPAARDEKTGDIAHPALVYVLGPDGTIRYTFNNPSPVWLVEAVTRIKRHDA